MSQHDLVINNDSGINVRLDINQAIQALGTLMLGTSAPSPTYPCELWADPSTAKIWIRNSANTAWLQFGKLDVANTGGIPAGGTTGQHLAKNSATDGDVLWSTPNYLPLTGGTVSGPLTVTGATVLQGSVTVQQPSGGNAYQWFTVVSTRSWLIGTDNGGNFIFNDQTAASTRVYIAPSGVLVANFGVNIAGNVNLTTGNLAGANVISSSADTGIREVTAAGNHARFSSQVSGQRQWTFGSFNDGTFHIYDATTPRDCFLIDGSGNVNLNSGGQFTVAGSIVTNGVFQVSRVAGQYSIIYFQTTGQDQWYMGTDASSNFIFVDVTAGNLIPLQYNKSGGFWTSNPIKVTGVGVMYPGVGGAEWYAMAGWASGHFGLYMNGSLMGTITPVTSDERYKENFGPPEGDALVDLGGLQLFSYDVPDRFYPENPSWHVTQGFSAQQMKKVIPEAVFTSPITPTADRDLNAKPYADDELMASFDPMPIIARCVGAIQQLNERVAALEARLPQPK